jgi:hypothetical protein
MSARRDCMCRSRVCAHDRHYLPPLAAPLSWENPKPARLACGREAERFTRDRKRVTCADCLAALAAGGAA